MGRRLGLLDHMFREMERSAKRRASEEARAERHYESMQRRAYERELVRQERASERERIQAEREQVKRHREASKEAQLAAWQAEYEEHQERSRELLTLCNDAPEIRERDRLYKELLEKNEYLPQPYVPPSPIQPDRSKLEQNHSQLLVKLDSELNEIKPSTKGYLVAAIIGGIVIIVGIICVVLGQIAEGVAISFLGFTGVLVARSLSHRAKQRQRETVRQQRLQAIEAQLEQEWALMSKAAEEESAQRELKARADYEQARLNAESLFIEQEAERIAQLRRLLSGDREQMGKVLEDLMPLDLPINCTGLARFSSADKLTLELAIPEPTIIPSQEAKLLQSGKLSYKDKSPKRIREEYSKLVAGLALRYASEIMLHLPTVKVVQIEAWRKVVDGTTGHEVEQMFLELTVDYETLAKLKMEGIDPAAALKNFAHHLGEGRTRTAAN